MSILLGSQNRIRTSHHHHQREGNCRKPRYNIHIGFNCNNMCCESMKCWSELSFVNLVETITWCLNCASWTCYFSMCTFDYWTIISWIIRLTQFIAISMLNILERASLVILIWSKNQSFFKLPTGNKQLCKITLIA